MRNVAIAVYIDNKPKIITEFGWLYNSWLISGSHETSDIVAFYNPKIKSKLPVHTDIVYIPLVPISEQDFTWENYPFINSIWYLNTIEADFLKNYEYVLRTDNDCFLTPYFPTLKPRLATFGIGMYATEPDVAIRLANIAKKWDFHFPFNNVGSTLMAKSEDVLKYSILQFRFCNKLRNEEFSEVGKWPGWFYGVLSMYAGQLAASAYFGMNMVLGGLDVHPSSQDTMCKTDYHIHAFHTWDHFSKLAWDRGDYKDYDMSRLDKTKINNYCLLIAGPGL